MSIFGSSEGSAPRLKPLPSKRSHVVSVLDIGSTKVVCMIARLTPRESTEILPGRTHKVEIIGHTDNQGLRSANQGLSQARAATVKDYLASHGIAEAQLSASGQGPDRPIASNDTAEGRARNRRIEFRLAQ